MKNNHKVPDKEAQKWIGAFEKLKKELKININNFFLEKQTWKELSGDENMNRIRVYFGLEGTPSGKLSACAYAVSTILDGSGIYHDQVQKIYKLEPRNINSSGNLEEVKKYIQAWKDWRKEESATEGAVQKQLLPLFPNAFLLHAGDLKELFAKQGKNKIKLEFGMDSAINLLMSVETLARSTSSENEYFDFHEPCPPYCDPESPL